VTACLPETIPKCHDAIKEVWLIVLPGQFEAADHCHTSRQSAGIAGRHLKKKTSHFQLRLPFISVVSEKSVIKQTPFTP